MSGTDLPTQEISDEEVDRLAKLVAAQVDPSVFGETYYEGMSMTGRRVLDRVRDGYREGVRDLLAALVASGYRREADLRHDEEVLLAAWDAAAELLGEAAKGARQRSISANYAEGLTDAADALAETVAEMRAQRPATALEQAQPLPVAADLCGEVGTGWPNGSYADPTYTEPCALPFDHEEDHDWAQREALEQAQPLLADGLEVESLELVDSPVIDMGYMSLPVEIQAEAEEEARLVAAARVDAMRKTGYPVDCMCPACASARAEVEGRRTSEGQERSEEKKHG